ncbi:hypothetical protein [Acinetobacter tianfuensis]|uniref:Lipoprotein n=1 Tax=Acinetobacter tianfuensis TaxID=2419603 RepID=A0A3A8EI73_9GAMM|nr:hypothetical protein [Acinetobacter tianfuensis]RKG29684.1 hypothetical protein D7V32_14000 [Acinetobacter tianfuensis]
MKKIVFPLLLFILPLTACNSSSETETRTQSSTARTDAKLSQESKEIINEYNQIFIKSQHEPAPQNINQKLKDILPKISQINSEKERNNLSLNINMRLGNYAEAYAITNKILAIKETANMKNFQCLLIEVLKKPKNEIEGCYLYSANLYKKQLDNMTKDDPYYDQTEWAYYASLLHANKTEYKSKLRQLADSKSAEDKQTYETMYEIETTPDGRKSILDNYKP